MTPTRTYAAAATIYLFFLVGCGNPDPDQPGVALAVPTRVSDWGGPHLDGKRIQSANYAIYTTSKSRPLLDAMPGFLEAAWENYHRICQMKTAPPRQPQTVYLFANYKQWVAMARHVMSESQAAKVAGIQAGGFYQHKPGGGACIFWNIGGIGALAVASHEGMHQFFDAQFDDQLPMWVEEGLSTVAEGYQISSSRVRFTPDDNQGRSLQLQRVVARGEWIDIADLISMDAGQAIGPRPGQALGYYAQLWALMQMIRTDPKMSAGLADLLADAQDGKLQETLRIDPDIFRRLPKRTRRYNHLIGRAAFVHYISEDPTAINQRFRTYAARLAKIQPPSARIIDHSDRFDIAIRPISP